MRGLNKHTSKIIKQVACITLCSSLFVACANMNKPPRVYWGSYSETLYQLKKEPSEASLTSHQGELLKIIEKSKGWNILPPPGVCAELAKIYLEQGDKKLALSFLEQEVAHYPEAKPLISRVIGNINKDS